MRLSIRDSPTGAISLALLQFTAPLRGTATYESGLVTRQTGAMPDACATICSGPDATAETLSTKCSAVQMVDMTEFQSGICMSMLCNCDFLDGIDNCIICNVEHSAMSQAAAKDTASQWTGIRKGCVADGYAVDATSKAEQKYGGASTSTGSSNGTSSSNSTTSDASALSGPSATDSKGTANGSTPPSTTSANTNGNAASAHPAVSV